jgi:hypothetical protein
LKSKAEENHQAGKAIVTFLTPLSMIGATVTFPAPLSMIGA